MRDILQCDIQVKNIKMKINYKINFKKISKIFFRRKYIEYIFILLFIGLMGFAGFVVYEYASVVFHSPPEEKILEIQTRQTKVKTEMLEEVLIRIEEKESNFAGSIEKEFSNPFLPY